MVLGLVDRHANRNWRIGIEDEVAVRWFVKPVSIADYSLVRANAEESLETGDEDGFLTAGDVGQFVFDNGAVSMHFKPITKDKHFRTIKVLPVYPRRNEAHAIGVTI